MPSSFRIQSSGEWYRSTPVSHVDKTAGIYHYDIRVVGLRLVGGINIVSPELRQ